MVAKCRSCYGRLHWDGVLWHHEYCAMHEPEPIEIRLGVSTVGNHEFCVECGESDFHRGEPCDPAVKAAYQALRKAIRTTSKNVDFSKPFVDAMLENLRNGAK